MRRGIPIIIGLALAGCPKPTPSGVDVSTPVTTTSPAPAAADRRKEQVEELLASWRPAEALTLAKETGDAALVEKAQRCVDAHGLGAAEPTILALLALPREPWREGAVAHVASTSEFLRAPNALAPDRSIDGAHAALPGQAGGGKAAPAEQIGLQQTIDRAHRLFVLVLQQGGDPARLERAEKDLAWFELRGFKGRVAADIEQKLTVQQVQVHVSRLMALLASGKKAEAASGVAAFREAHPNVAVEALAAIERAAKG